MSGDEKWDIHRQSWRQQSFTFETGQSSIADKRPQTFLKGIERQNNQMWRKDIQVTR